MSKRAPRRFVEALIISWVVAFTLTSIAIFFIQELNSIEAANKGSAYEEQKGRDSPIWSVTIHDPAILWSAVTAIFTMVLAVFTVILAAGSIYLVLVTRRGIADQAGLTQLSIDNADRTSRSQLRAYMSAKDIGSDVVVDSIIQNRVLGWSFYYNWHNAGQTPAKNIEVSAFYNIASDLKGHPIFDPIDFSKIPDRIKHVIGPGLGARGAHANIEVGRFRNRARNFVLNKISYTDIFEQSYDETVCVEIECRADPFVLVVENGQLKTPFIYKVVNTFSFTADAP